jgi:hypothetical protein
MKFLRLLCITTVCVFSMMPRVLPAYSWGNFAATVGFTSSVGKFFSRAAALTGGKKFARSAKIGTEFCSAAEAAATLLLPATTGEKIGLTTLGANIRVDAGAQIAHFAKIVRALWRAKNITKGREKDVGSSSAEFQPHKSIIFAFLELLLRSWIFAQMVSSDAPESLPGDPSDADFEPVWRQFKVVGLTVLAGWCDLISRRFAGQKLSLVEEGCLRVEKIGRMCSIIPVAYNALDMLVRVAIEEDDREMDQNYKGPKKKLPKDRGGFEELWRRLRDDSPAKNDENQSPQEPSPNA